jgi:hypothetical protein
MGTVSGTAILRIYTGIFEILQRDFFFWGLYGFWEKKPKMTLSNGREIEVISVKWARSRGPEGFFGAFLLLLLSVGEVARPTQSLGPRLDHFLSPNEGPPHTPLHQMTPISRGVILRHFR